MKKEYIIPETDVVRVNIESSFCLDTSGSEGGDDQFGKGNDPDAEWED